MTFALFANRSLDTQGGWLDLRETGTLDECRKADLWDCDWAHIVNIEADEVVHMKARTKKDQDLTDVPWEQPSVEYIDADVPVVLRAEVLRVELQKFLALGGEHWLRAQLAGAELPVIPQVASALDLLKSIEELPMPVHITEPVAVVQAQELMEQGLVEAELSHTPGESATVLSITEAGRLALLPTSANP